MNSILIAECYFDTLIIEILTGNFGWTKGRDYWHVEGTKVFTSMKERANNDKGITVGFFDKNKKLYENKYINSFENEREENGIQWLKNPNKANQHIFYLKDGAEEWFLETTKSAALSPLTYNISENIIEFKKKTKKLAIEKDNELYQLVKAVIGKNPPQIKTLQEYIFAVFGEQKKFNN